MEGLSYAEALEALDRAVVFGINPSLDGITALCDELGRPQDSLVVVQIAGTNGKTSTARLTHAMLRALGCSVGLYTSPQLQRMNERIELNDGPVSDEQFAQAISAAIGAAETLCPGHQGASDGFTEFELTTAAALWLFREQGVQIAVLEVGLGGRWDATSVAMPAVAVITGVGMDHTDILGDTLEQIASEKAAIIRPASAPVLGPGTVETEQVLLTRAEALSTHARAVRPDGQPTPVAEELTIRYRLDRRPASPSGSLTVDVHGVHGSYDELHLSAPAYQAGNVATALAAVECVLGGAPDRELIQFALDSVRLPARFELVRDQPPVVIDGAHNPQAAASLAGAIRDAWPDPASRPLLVLGVLADKDAAGIVRALSEVLPSIIVTTPRSPRALAAHDLARVVESETGRAPACVVSLERAIEIAVAARNGAVITGSLTTAGQARSLLLDASATA